MLFWILASLVLFAITLYFRPIFPLDETRYASVTWEMWLGHHFLIPIKNGLAYPDKPPLLFWCFLAGWHLFGVSTWWLRSVPAIFALGTLFLTRRLALPLWPDKKNNEKKHFLAGTHYFIGLLLLG